MDILMDGCMNQCKEKLNYGWMDRWISIKGNEKMDGSV